MGNSKGCECKNKTAGFLVSGEMLDEPRFRIGDDDDDDEGAMNRADASVYRPTAPQRRGSSPSPPPPSAQGPGQSAPPPAQVRTITVRSSASLKDDVDGADVVDGGGDWQASATPTAAGTAAAGGTQVRRSYRPHRIHLNFSCASVCVLTLVAIDTATIYHHQW